MTADDWITGLSRIHTRPDLPITFQGGEPTIHSGFYKIAEVLHFQHTKHLDLLTNGMFDIRTFCSELPTDVFKRNAKYASIRVSFHTKTDRYALALKTWELQNRGYEIGIWGLGNTAMNKKMAILCKQLNIDFRLKEFLSKDSGTYKYPNGHTKQFRKEVLCKPSEFLIGPSGHIFRCHADLYSNSNWIGHILDETITFPDFLPCSNYGHCNPCDLKNKTNRLQEAGHCSVEIKEVIK
jgi:hypothetical protein